MNLAGLMNDSPTPDNRLETQLVNRQANPRANQSNSPAVCPVGTSSIKLWSLNTEARLILQFSRAGVSRTIKPSELALHGDSVILVRADAVLDQPLIPVLVERSNFVLIGEGPKRSLPIAAHVCREDAPAAAAFLLDAQAAGAPPRAEARSPSELSIAFWQNLRKSEVPYALVVDECNKAQVEWRTFMGTYKGATDIVTKRLWPVPAFYATRAIAKTPITPNHVTILAAVLVFVAFFLFLHGYFALGLVAARLMTFLDTDDGKLARTTLTSSKLGYVLDHGIDLVHPPFWYTAWALGLSPAGFQWSAGYLGWVLGIIFGGYLLQRLMEGVALKWLGMEIHIWRPIDTRFREITARRNTNLIILTVSVIFGRPDIGLLGVAAWISICLLLHGVQLAQALIYKGRSGPLVSWMREPVNLK
jgi:phosphatidylglycerophosphate synthase